MTTGLPTAFVASLPRGVDLDDCEITTYANLIADYDVDTYPSAVVDDDAPALVLPGWCADDGNAEIYYPLADTAEEAAQEYVDTGDWGDVTNTDWVAVYAWRTAIVLCDDGETVDLILGRDRHTVEIEPEEPDCVDGHDHDWQSPHEVLGGLRENPGVWGHGGGVIMRDVCAHCGVYRVTDTWAQCRDTGEQGLTSVAYEDADDDSLAWVGSLADDAA